MKKETKFYNLLYKAKNDELSLILVMNKLMPIINKYSINENDDLDEDLRSYLMEYAIKIIKDKEFLKKLIK